MNCYQKIQYIIRPGDNLYQLARSYQTTVQDILALNPNIDPYNLQIGSAIFICPGGQLVPSLYGENQSGCPNSSLQFSLLARMREVWAQRVYWMRMLLISIADGLRDQSATAARLMQNPSDTAAIFSNYYSANTARVIEQLLIEYLRIGAALITALRDGRTEQAEDLKQRWYQNADQMADAFSKINPYYPFDDVRQMLHEQLDSTIEEINARIAGNYPADIAAFGDAEQKALAAADFFSSGIMMQFPNRFV